MIGLTALSTTATFSSVHSILYPEKVAIPMPRNRKGFRVFLLKITSIIFLVWAGSLNQTRKVFRVFTF
jgi:hypothetical protein